MVWLINWFGDNPIKGAVSSVGSFVAGAIADFNPVSIYIINADIKNEVLFYFKCLAFLISIMTGILTIVSFHHKFKDRHNGKN